jgi:hypothetical protein
LRRKIGYVTKEDCDAAMTPLAKDMTTVKDALVGPDLRGGLVGDVKELKVQFKHLEEREANRKHYRTWWEVTIVGATVAATSIIVNIIFHIV